MEATIGFPASNRSGNHLERGSNCSWLLRAVKKRDDRDRFPSYLRNQQAWRKMNDAIRFSASNRHEHPLIRSSNHSSWCFVRALKKRGIKIIGHVPIYISATRHAIAKGTAAFDSRRQISLNTPWNGILIVDGAPASVDQKIG